MLLNVILIILGIVGIVAGIVFAFDKVDKESLTKTRRIGASISFVLALVFIVSGFTVKIINTGYTGVRIVFGQVSEKTLQSGLHFKVPFLNTIKTINNKQQDVEFKKDKIWSETSERTPIFYSGVTVTYQINAEKSTWIYANVSDYEDNLVSQSLVASGIKSASVTLGDTEATNRGKIEPLAQEYIQNSIDNKYGENIVKINKVVIGNSDFEESYNEVLVKKQQSQLTYEQQKIENTKSIEKAEADAKVKLTNAQADADAKKIAAKAEADANRTVADSLSGKIMEKMFYDKWNGTLPYSIGDNMSIMDISKFNK